MESESRLLIAPFEKGRVTWAAMLSRCPNATLYHQIAWLELLSLAYGFSLHLAMLEEEGCIVATCILARTKAPLVRRFVSLPFSDYCPPLALDIEAARRLMKALAEQGLQGAALEVRGIAAIGGWEPVERFVIFTLPLSRGLESLERELSMNFRRNLKRAARENIVVSRGNGEDDLRRFYRLQVLTRRKFGLPAQPWRFFKLLREKLSSSCGLDVWIANRGGSDVAGAVLLSTGDTVYYKWGARLPGDDSRANHLLLWNAIEDYCSRAERFDLGRTDSRNHGLIRFKMELGGKATPLTYSYYPRAPREVSPEALGGVRKSIAAVWSRLPAFATRALGGAVYRYLA